MNFTFNGETPSNINYNGFEVSILKYNGETVWEKSSPEPEPTDLEKSVILTLDDGSTDVVTFEDGKIPSRTFSGRNDIVEAIIGSEITEVGTYAFRSCTNLEHVIWKSSQNHIKTATFSSCSSLVGLFFPNATEVYFFGTPTRPVTGTSSFLPLACVIYVPDELYGEWGGSSYWRPYHVEPI